MRGYIKVISLCCIVGIIIIAFLLGLNAEYKTLTNLEESRTQIQGSIVSHYQWRSDLGISLQTGRQFTGGLDPNTCSFGKWISDHTQNKKADSQVLSLISAAKAPHERIHTLAQELLNTSNSSTAYQRFVDELTPMTDEVINQLNQIDAYYATQLNKAKDDFETLVTMIILLTVFATLLIAGLSSLYATRISRRISLPVTKVADWANKLSLGAIELDVDEEFNQIQEENRDNEVGAMIQAFQAMAANIQENVNVVQRVADGDMTAFVNIRSSHDSLGRSLYRLVQSNDAVFNDIVQAAQTVAAGAGEIANASHSLAESATAQAAAVHSLSSTVQHARDLILQNNEKATQANQITLKIKEDAKISNEHMAMLVDSVMQISDASKRISTVIKSIDDIAFETNILALNAAIEAARAGSAGKGFAVVADEVRALALKSTEAAKESKQLIEGSIQKAQKGSVIASESASIFASINEEIDQVVDIVAQVAGLSTEQMKGIDMVNREIVNISETASSNAAISEQSAASSREMSSQAEILRTAMHQFNLRKRAEGKAFIPQEKRYDQDFIRAANEAYQNKERTGEFGQEYIDPLGKEMESTIWGDDTFV